jgi:phosphatidylglycerol---prolipoprotein diacylglyceryl transferase
MIIHNFDPVLIDLGFFQIRWYSLAYILGITLGWLYINKIIKFLNTNEYRANLLQISQFDNLIIYLVLGIILGGRFGYVLFYNFSYYNQNLSEILKLWEGGMSFHGGLLGVIIATLIYSKIIKINFFKFTDVISCAAPIGIFFGRVANYINGELYGKISFLPWAVIFPNQGSLPRHPSQIYEAILEGVILFLLINYFALKKKLLFKPGYISGLFLVFYSILRIVGEKFREPDSHIGYFLNYFSLGMLLSFITLIFGLLVILFIKKNEKYY